MPYVGVGVIVVFVLVVAAYVVWRFRQGGQMESGGSMGQQMFGRDKDDWGPKPSDGQPSANADTDPAQGSRN
jgi:ABC-type spermidine/putrescine transport system permease subunit I